MVVLERKQFPRDKTCGDGLTPRAVKQLGDMGLGDEMESYHRFGGLRAVAHGHTRELPWPEHAIYPSYGYVVRRSTLDAAVLEHARTAGALVWNGVEATEPLLVGSLCRGVRVVDRTSGQSSDVEASYLVVADGANSRVGRGLGCRRERAWPQGMAIRTYFESPNGDDPWIESALDVRDRNGATLPGYGWIFPLGDGTVNVGIGLLTSYRDWRNVNTSHLMEEWAYAAPERWSLDPTAPLAPPVGGRLPMAGSVNPKAGPNFLVVGDAAGSVNPFNGEGIDYAYETGRLAAELVAEAVICDDGLALSRYPELLESTYGAYYKVARLFAYAIGRPRLISRLVQFGMQSQTLMEWALRIMANLMHEDDPGAAEYIYKVAAAAAWLWPD